MALSDISLTAGMRNSLFVLGGIANSIDRTQVRLATGRKVNSALDNPTNFFAAQTYLQRASDLSERKDGVLEAMQTVGAANNGINAISTLLESARGIANAALSTSDQAARDTLARQFDLILDQMDAMQRDSSYRGTNLLDSQSLTVNFAETSGQSTLTIGGVDASCGGLGVDHALSAGTSTTPTTTTASNNIALGGSDPVVINDDGTITAVGGDYGGVPVPSGLTGVAAVSSGTAFSLALKNDGTVVAWGDNTYGQATVPSGLNNVTAVSAGKDFGLALKSDGTVVAWGNNTYGQATVPVGLSDVVAISAGYDFALALKSDGTVVAWGDNQYGQTEVPSGLTNVTAISAGNFALALKGDGTVIGWGNTNNDYGQTATSGLSGITAIAAGVNFGLALDSNGDVVGWGDNTFGQRTIPSLGTVVAIAAGAFGGLALDTTGAAVGWGPFPIDPLSLVKTTGDTITITANNWSTTGGIETSLNQVADAIDTLRATTKVLSSNNNIVTTRQSFMDGMINTLKTGSDNLTLADMNEEASNMLMLQTQRSLAMTGLSLSNQAAQSVLRLF